MPLIPANTHPFLADDLCFAHNGYAWTAATMDTLVRESGAPRPLGDTDSERYLSLVRASLAEHGAPRRPASSGGAHRRTRLHRRRSTACCWCPARCTPWHGGTHPRIRAQPDGETERDYRLWYRVDPDRVLVASAGMQGHDAGLAGAATRAACWRSAGTPWRRPSTAFDEPLPIHPQSVTSLQPPRS